MVQGGLTALGHPLLGFIVGTSIYVLYHKAAPWPWLDVLAVSLVGVPVALAFWLMPGAPSLLAVSIIHIAATTGFIGPGPYLMRRLRLVGD